MTITNSLVLADNAYGTLGSGLLTSDTTLTWTAGHGARFPVVGAGQVLYCCLLNSNNVVEEIKITAHTAGADTATMVRAANGTTAKAWNVGDRVEARVSSEVLKRLQDESLKATTLTTADSGLTYTGSMDVVSLGYINGVTYPMTIATTNSTATPTISLDSNSAITVALDGGVAIAIGQMPLNGLYKFDGTYFILLNPLAWTTGDVKLTMKASADGGWVMCNDGSIGNAASGGTSRANADALNLFTLLWNNVSNTYAPVSTGRGSTAAADFAANKNITLTAMLGRALAIGGAGSGLTSRSLGQTVGEENHVLIIPEIPSHSHFNQGQGATGAGGLITLQSTASGPQNNTATDQTANTGGGGAHNNMQPTAFLNAMIKL